MKLEPMKAPETTAKMKPIKLLEVYIYFIDDDLAFDEEEFDFGLEP